MSCYMCIAAIQCVACPQRVPQPLPKANLFAARISVEREDDGTPKRQQITKARLWSGKVHLMKITQSDAKREATNLFVTFKLGCFFLQIWGTGTLLIHRHQPPEWCFSLGNPTPLISQLKKEDRKLRCPVAMGKKSKRAPLFCCLTLTPKKRKKETTDQRLSARAAQAAAEEPGLRPCAGAAVGGEAVGEMAWRRPHLLGTERKAGRSLLGFRLAVGQKDRVTPKWVALASENMKPVPWWVNLDPYPCAVLKHRGRRSGAQNVASAHRRMPSAPSPAVCSLLVRLNEIGSLHRGSI